MRISGFTFVRNATKLDFPLEPSIRSVLPLVDEMIVAVGDSEDDTRERVLEIRDSRIRIIDTIWDPALFHKGRILAQQTDIALAECHGDWCVYIQADEVLHEDGYTTIENAMQRYLHDPRVEGLLLPYVHFYGSYHTVCTARPYYRQEIRIVRSNIGVRSYKDAQGFRIGDRKLQVVRLEKAPMYHYGWTRPPDLMRKKIRHHWRMWHRTPDDHLEQWQYVRQYGVKYFKGTHPATIQALVTSRPDNDLDLMRQPRSWSFKYLREAFSAMIEWLTGGWRPGEWKNFKEPKPRHLDKHQQIR